jgi:hypothetical protein
MKASAKFNFVQVSMVLAAGLFVTMGSLSTAFAKDATCKVKTNDIGTIIGRGADESAAFEDAATQCFDRYTSLSRAKDRTPAEDAQISWIDICANVKCG